MLKLFIETCVQQGMCKLLQEVQTQVQNMTERWEKNTSLEYRKCSYIPVDPIVIFNASAVSTSHIF